MILSITRQPMMMIPESWYSISRWRQGIIQPSTTRRRILMRRNTLATGGYFGIAFLLSFSSRNLTTCHPHVCYRRDGVRMPPTSDHERFFQGFNADSSDDHRAYTPNRDRGRRINTPGRASGNTHRMDERTPGAEAHLNRYNNNMSTRGPRFQPRVIADRHHHNSSELSSSSSREWSVSPERHSPTPTPQPDRNLGHSNRSSRSNSPTPRQFEHSRSSCAPSHRTLVTTQSLDHSSYGSSSISRLARNVSGGHCLAMAYSGSQGQGSRGSSSGQNHSSSRNPSDCSTMRRHGTRQTPLRSTSTVSTSNLQTPLMLNIFTNDNRYAVDSHDFSSHHSNLTDLGGEQPSPSASSNPPIDADASYANQWRCKL